MLNLQTIAESLNTKCKGQSWVFVTSQEDMDKVVGDRTKKQGNDFSKIQARFKARVKLTSADVEEVIRKRLLEKNDKGTQVLEAVYAQEAGNFKTLFDFVDGAKTYRNFAAEYARLQEERVKAFKEFAMDVNSGGYPQQRHNVAIADTEFDEFRAELGL